MIGGSAAARRIRPPPCRFLPPPKSGDPPLDSRWDPGDVAWRTGHQLAVIGRRTKVGGTALGASLTFFGIVRRGAGHAGVFRRARPSEPAGSDAPPSTLSRCDGGIPRESTSPKRGAHLT